eukprot:scaffold3146_cov98-Isochrysis_galbana.AAC.7
MAVQLIGVALGECVLRVSGHLVVQVGGTRFRREIIYLSFLTENWSRGVSPPSKENSAATGSNIQKNTLQSSGHASACRYIASETPTTPLHFQLSLAPQLCLRGAASPRPSLTHSRPPT